MPRAIWKGAVLAESNDTIVVENNHYFPPEAIAHEHFQPSNEQTFCSWKGTAHYYDLVVGGARNPAAAWYYDEPMDAASHIKKYVAFWKGVSIE